MTQRSHNDHRRWPSGFRRMILGSLCLVLAILFTPILVFGILYGAYRLHALVVILPLLLVISLFVVVIARAKLSNIGFRFGVHGVDYLYPHRCTHCTGGAQTLNTDSSPDRKSIGWGPIPEKNRLWFDGTDYFHSPLGNVRSCTYCNGRGFLLLPYPPKDNLTVTTESDRMDTWPE